MRVDVRMPVSVTSVSYARSREWWTLLCGIGVAIRLDMPQAF